MVTMDSQFFVVKWVHEVPIRFSIMARNDIVDPETRQQDPKLLVTKEIGFKWKTKTCDGVVIAAGPKSEMESALHLEIAKTKPPVSKPPKARLQVQAANQLATRTRIDAVLQNLSHDEIQTLKDELAAKERRCQDLEGENGKLKEEVEQLKFQLANTDSNVDIGNGIILSREYLTTVKSTSSNINAFARSLFKKLFSVDEIVGYSLMGKKCNANAGDQQPAVDPRRRDAILEYVPKSFGKLPGTETYSLTKKDVKKSLACLILEITKDVKRTEVEVGLAGVDPDP